MFFGCTPTLGASSEASWMLRSRGKMSDAKVCGKFTTDLDFGLVIHKRLWFYEYSEDLCERVGLKNNTNFIVILFLTF